MKTLIILLLVAALATQAQAQPAPDPAPVATDSEPAIDHEALRRALRQATEGQADAAGAEDAAAPATTNQPAIPAAPGVPAPTAPLTPVAPGAPSPAPTTPPVGAPAAPAAPPAEEEQILPAGTINFPATEINQVLQIYAELVGRTILRPTTLGGTITLKTQTPLTRREAIQAFDAVLAMNGITMINIGDKFVKAVPATEANTHGAPLRRDDYTLLPELGPYVTHVVQLKYARPSELVQVLQPFAKLPAGILPIDSSQILVLRDYTENVKRMLELIDQIDVAVPSEFISEVIPIKYALAGEIASALNSLSAGGGATTVGARAPTTRPGTTAPGYRPGVPGAPGTVTPPGTPGAPGTAPGTPSFTERLQSIIRRASATGDIQVLGQTKIIADERINALLIFATRQDMEMIKDVISKLDVVLAQVLIEAVILQVRLTDDQSLGISYLQHPKSIGDFTGVGALNTKGFLSPGNFVISGATNIAGGPPGGFSYLGRFNQDLDVTLTAIASDTRFKILQRPRIQTSHAVEATLFVGQSRPYPTSSYYSGGFGGYSSIQQLQIGVTLRVLPLINPDGLVVMDIHQKVESFEGNVNIENVGEVPITSQKDATAKVAVRDRETIMLGGLIENAKSRTTSGVPLLKDIPLLGYLFRSTSDTGDRNELIVLIRPTVLPTPEVAALAAREEKAQMPGIVQAEAEFRAAETKRLKKAEKYQFEPVERQ